MEKLYKAVLAQMLKDTAHKKYHKELKSLLLKEEFSAMCDAAKVNKDDFSKLLLERMG